MKKLIAVIGLGYVGLPLAIELSKKFDVLGYDINLDRINSLKKKVDLTKEVKKSDLKKTKICFTNNNEKLLRNRNFFIVTVPTPLLKNKKPDLSPLKKASEIISRYIKKGDIVVYESTVYPGCTRDFCIPILKRKKKLELNKDFYCGYSPERINPGDKKHRVHNITKIISGSNNYATRQISNVYKSIVTAGIYKASSIEVAESAKIIENTQRDLNIAFMNELSLFFQKLKIDTNEVLKAASTKWNFVNFKPGLVGGHCINVDPYYLTYKANLVGFNTKTILAGRLLNDSMHQIVFKKFKKKINKNFIKTRNLKILLMGITFKENCPDIRNSQVIKIYNNLKKNYKNVDVYDPVCNHQEIKKNKINILKKLRNKKYDGIIIAVKHKEFKKFNFVIKKFIKKNTVICDLTNTISNNRVNISF